MKFEYKRPYLQIFCSSGPWVRICRCISCIISILPVPYQIHVFMTIAFAKLYFPLLFTEYILISMYQFALSCNTNYKISLERGYWRFLINELQKFYDDQNSRFMTFTNDRGISYELQTLFIAPIPVNVFCIKQKKGCTY